MATTTSITNSLCHFLGGLGRKVGTVGGSVVSLNNMGCRKSDIPDGIAGKIALVPCGDCEAAYKEYNAFHAGAIVTILRTITKVLSKDTLCKYSLQSEDPSFQL
ncbi:hypothetical protein WAI453_013472 [Rhynchosporium graminicola]